MQTITKTARDGDDLRCEAAALSWLAGAETHGGLHAARVLEASRGSLTEELVATGPVTAQAAETMGRALARTHAAGAPWWGAPPDGWPRDDAPAGYTIAGTLTPVVPQPTFDGWGRYFWAVRLEPFVRGLSEDGFFDRRATALLERVGARLCSGDFDAPQPRLVEQRGHRGLPAVARLHGDLWAGNLLADTDPANPTGGTLIDPMAHGGHAETDLAMLRLFGYPRLEVLIGAYDAESPLADGWRERVALHQLAPLLHHCLLYGAAYGAETLDAARRYA